MPIFFLSARSKFQAVSLRKANCLRSSSKARAPLKTQKSSTLSILGAPARSDPPLNKTAFSNTGNILGGPVPPAKNLARFQSHSVTLESFRNQPQKIPLSATAGSFVVDIYFCPLLFPSHTLSLCDIFGGSKCLFTIRSADCLARDRAASLTRLPDIDSVSESIANGTTLKKSFNLGHFRARTVKTDLSLHRHVYHLEKSCRTTHHQTHKHDACGEGQRNRSRIEIAARTGSGSRRT